MNIRMLYVWPNLKNLTFHLTELSTEPVLDIITTMNRLYGKARIVELTDVSDNKVEQLVNLENSYVEAGISVGTSKNAEVLFDFTQYCKKNPSQRFWQALRNWSGARFILAVGGNADSTSEITVSNHDTFYREGK